MTLNELGKEIRAINKANGWGESDDDIWTSRYVIPTIIALIHSEVSEALEAFRKHDPEHIAEELADTLIRVLDASERLGFDMDKAVRDKLEVNKTRGYRHGGKVV